MTTTPAAAASDGHVSVIYFHGMGSQRRYEETSRLIDSVDSYLSNEHRERGNSRGFLSGIKPKVEPFRMNSDETVTYIRTRYAPDGENKYENNTEVRYYEAYWAPIMAGSSSARRVALWILRQSIRPWQTLTTVWRERQRLRRSALANLADRRDSWPEGTEQQDFDKLLRAYGDFEGLGAKRRYKKGTFDEFQAFLAEENKDDPVTAGQQRALADAWVSHYRRTEFKNAFGIASILLALALVSGLLVWSTLQLMTLILEAPLLSKSNFLFKSILGESLSPSLSTAAGLVLGVIMALGLGRFLVDYMGDVEAWATYEETDLKHQRRKRVMAMGTGLMKHVLADENCKRVIVISHSLGTSVAHDTLLSVARDNRATNAQDPIGGPIRLDKIRHFVTMASPIDKINYFFESYRSDYHRYTRVIETLRGDISNVPFARNQKPYVHWVNFYDEADIISGSLQSPVGTKSLSARVDNVHVANLHFPNPGKSHSAYFDNRGVISRIFDMTYLDAGNYGDLKYDPKEKGLNYNAAQMGPGADFGHSRWFLVTALAIPWLGLSSLLLWLLGSPLGAWISYVIVAILAGLVLIAAVKSRQGQRLPL
ncbi:MAG: hypothetical protein WBB25_05960 [Sulfitobacter sp.]